MSLFLVLLSISMCNGEAIPDNEDRLYFSISSYVGEVSKPRVTPSPVVPHQDQAVPPRVTTPPVVPSSVTPPQVPPLQQETRSSSNFRDSSSRCNARSFTESNSRICKVS